MRSLSANKYRFIWYTCPLLLFVLFAAKTEVYAQVDTIQENQTLVLGKRIIIETHDGSVIIGRFMGHTDDGIRILTESASETVVANKQINWMKVVDEGRYKDGEYWFENPNSTRYLFSPSAFNLKKGEAYYQNTYLVINSFNYGLTDNFSIGGGFEFISALSGDPIFFITPKYSFGISEKLRAGAGVLYARLSDNNTAFSGMGIGYGILTYGNTDDNITLGLGYGYVEEELADRPIFTLSGMKRLNRRFGLVTENWIVPTDGYYGVYSYGMRFMGERITVDLALLNNKDIASDVSVIGFPYIDFVVKFGK